MTIWDATAFEVAAQLSAEEAELEAIINQLLENAELSEVVLA